MSPRTILFQVLDKSPVSGPGRGPLSCNRTKLSAHLHAPPLPCMVFPGIHLHWLQVSAVHYDNHKHDDRYSRSISAGGREELWLKCVNVCVCGGCVCMCGVQTLLFIAIISLFSFLSTHRHYFKNHQYSHASQIWNFYSCFSLKASICLNSILN